LTQVTPTAVYHWFDDHGDSAPYSNLRVPIIVSIATLRAVNPDIPILVLAQEDRDWGDFPEKLQFEVKRIPFHLNENHRIKGWRHLSRIFDIQKFSRLKNVMYVDSDVFWFRDPLPLHHDFSKFCFDGWNTGFFYYNRYANEEFFDIFEAYAKVAIYSHDFRKIMRDHIGYDAWYEVWDEMIITYMKKNHSELFNFIPVHEHSSGRNIGVQDPKMVKMFHCNGTMVPNEVPKSPNEYVHCRGLLGIIIEEFYELLQSVLTKNDIKQIYSVRELHRYLPCQFSLLKDPRRLTRTLKEDEHFHVGECLVPQKLSFI